MLNLETVEFKNRLNAAFNDRFAEKVKESMSLVDPTIDWSLANVICDFELGKFQFEVKSDSVREQIRKAYEQVLADDKK